MNTTTNETLTKLMNLRDEGARLAASYERASQLVSPSTKVIKLMGIVSVQLMQNAREYAALRDTLPIQ